MDGLIRNMRTVLYYNIFCTLHTFFSFTPLLLATMSLFGNQNKYLLMLLKATGKLKLLLRGAKKMSGSSLTVTG